MKVEQASVNVNIFTRTERSKLFSSQKVNGNQTPDVLRQSNVQDLREKAQSFIEKETGFLSKLDSRLSVALTALNIKSNITQKEGVEIYLRSK